MHAGKRDTHIHTVLGSIHIVFPWKQVSGVTTLMLITLNNEYNFHTE